MIFVAVVFVALVIAQTKLLKKVLVEKMKGLHHADFVTGADGFLP